MKALLTGVRWQKKRQKNTTESSTSLQRKHDELAFCFGTSILFSKIYRVSRYELEERSVE